MTTKFIKTKYKSRQAFTLIELIVVLVILAIIAAVTVPALTGYIKDTKREKMVNNAQYALTAAQAVMTELYGLGPGAMTNTTLAGSGGGKGGDVRWDNKYNTNLNDANQKTNLEWGNKVLELMDRDRNTQPYILIFGVGNSTVKSLSTTEKYTVYYLAYVEDKNSPAVFYINGEWIYTYPRDDSKIMKEVNFVLEDGSTSGIRNTIVMNGAKIPLQMYVVSTYAKDNFWTGGADTLQGHSEKKN